ncbi:MAG: proline--tRNA ligase [bacterium]|nr:proline--tRNA ligase [bacterium]MDE0601984.1 proline--tRNA ligase [bacterium]
MRWSTLFIPTLRDDPAHAEAASHRLLLRGGFIRQLAAGHYSMLPLGQRVRAKVDRIIREEMDAIGGQQVHLPALHPAEVWRLSGRWEAMGEEMFRLEDRKGVEHCLGMTHEEVIALLAGEVFSYRDLPQVWYQIQTKFRDEPRPKSGVLRVREFTMKDSYSLDVDQAGLDVAFDLHHQAYTAIFRRCGLEALDVAASSGAMGGSESVEFMVPSPAGEDWIVTCDGCDYRANLERAVSVIPDIDDGPSQGETELLATPGIRTIRALAEAYPDRAAAERQIKTLVYVVDGQLTLVLLRGDHELLEQKLVDTLGVANLRPAHGDEIRSSLGADPGSLGAVGVKDLPVIADRALQGRRNLVTGANRDDWHLTSVDVERDIEVGQWADLRGISAGEQCPECGGTLDVWRGIEVGHIFKLGDRYSRAMGAMVQNPRGDSTPIVMGSYGIGVERTMAAVVEFSHDRRGIVWPVSVSPYHVVITVLRADDPETLAVGERLYDELTGAGVEALLDDRPERPGVKFADAELIGIPYRITVGPRKLAEGLVELTTRADLETVEVALAEVTERVAGMVNAALSAA